MTRRPAFAAALRAAAAALLPSLAAAQSTPLQAGPWTPGHVPQYTGNGSVQPVVQDGGAAGGGGLGANIAELGIVARGTGTAPYSGQGTGPFGSIGCFYDAPITNATGYHYLCMSPNATGGNGLISFGNAGGAAATALNFNINGSQYAFPVTVGGITGPGSTTIGHLVTWNNATGTLVADTTQVTLAQLPSIATATVLCNLTGGTTTPTACTSLPSAVQTGITGLGTVTAGTWQATTIGVAYGGTGLTAGISGGVLAFTGTGTLASSAALTANAPVIGGGAGAAPGVGSRSGNTTTFATTTGALVSGHAATFDASGNILDGGAAPVTPATAPLVVTTGNMTHSGGNLPATATNDSATTGNLGEYQSSSVAQGSAVSLSTNTPTNITSVSLTAGDWDCRGSLARNPAATTSFTSWKSSLNTLSATDGSLAAGTMSQQSLAANVVVGNFSQIVGPVRFSLAVTSTVYMIADDTFTVSTNAGYGLLACRRVR